MHAIRPSLAFSYIGSVTARHSSSGHQPNVAVWYNEWNYGTFAEGVTYTRLGGHHVGYRRWVISAVADWISAILPHMVWP